MTHCMNKRYAAPAAAQGFSQQCPMCDCGAAALYQTLYCLYNCLECCLASVCCGMS
jgi:hypothetical protein